MVDVGYWMLDASCDWQMLALGFVLSVLD